MKFHLIGVGGAGMSVVADLLLAAGHQVSGSDREESANVTRLEQAGATIYVGQSADQVEPDAVVVVSSAIKESNPELAVARNRNQEVWHRSEALAFASQGRDFIAVAGAHGKTSTSGMLAVAFDALGRDPSRAIGGSLFGGKSGGYLGTGSMLIAEADESDGSFLNYAPRIGLVTNVEVDHLDHYGSIEAFEQAFDDFAKRIVKGGYLICCADNEGSARLAERAREAGIRVWTYGRAHGDEHHIHLTDMLDAKSNSGIIEFRGQTYQIDLSVAGAHMLLNAAGAWAVGVALGEDGSDMARALAAFRGTGRRFELRGEVSGIRIIDDYAHHPTEVAATLATAKELGDGALRVVFQPHLYSRTHNFAAEFAAALDIADEVIVTSVYAAREEPEDGSEGDVIVARMRNGRYIQDMHDAAREIVTNAAPGDIIMTMGAGSITTCAPDIAAELSRLAKGPQGK